MGHVGWVTRWSRGVLGITTLALLVLLIAGTASAAHVEPEVVRGSPTCGDFSSGTEFNIFAPNERFAISDSGTFSDGTLEVAVTFYDTPEGQEFNWSANLEVDVIVAKGGSLASIYRYNPAVKADTGLHSPFNDTRSLWYPSTYISFCYNAEMPPPAQTTTTARVAATSQPKPETTITMAPTTTAEVLPTVVTTAPPTATTKPGAAVTTIPAEVLDTEVLPFTGMTDSTLWLLGLGLIAAGTTAVVSTRSSRRED